MEIHSGEAEENGMDEGGGCSLKSFGFKFWRREMERGSVKRKGNKIDTGDIHSWL